MSKQIAFILCLALTGCHEYQPEYQGGRIKLEEYHQSIPHVTIISIDSIEFLVHNSSGYMVRITKGGEHDH